MQDNVERVAPWIADQNRYDESGEQPTWRSDNPLVPSDYRLDLEFNCYTNAENLADADPSLTYVEGLARGSDGTWGNHAWCITSDGEVVDPYFEWKFPGERFEYKVQHNDGLAER